MRFLPVILLLGLLATGCGRYDQAIRQQITGTWRQAEWHTLTISPDGSYASVFLDTNNTVRLTAQGTWRVENRYLIVTVTNVIGSPPHDKVGDVGRWKVDECTDKRLTIRDPEGVGHEFDRE